MYVVGNFVYKGKERRSFAPCIVSSIFRSLVSYTGLPAGAILSSLSSNAIVKSMRAVSVIVVV